MNRYKNYEYNQPWAHEWDPAYKERKVAIAAAFREMYAAARVVKKNTRDRKFMERFPGQFIDRKRAEWTKDHRAYKAAKKKAFQLLREWEEDVAAHAYMQGYSDGGCDEMKRHPIFPVDYNHPFPIHLIIHANGRIEIDNTEYEIKKP